ncbi:hypothetical protein [Dyella acidiphila]|uniref:Uncharacterized protein n=1 Tax=Dyella acidiphila TaxID=2775866 RepID=A0ABR9GED4_9GAMM|nr:hypothetical protein [Dyella acidiphila]MBE1162388.1 hypothetical protein [Dyella acidiphila]
MLRPRFLKVGAWMVVAPTRNLCTQQCGASIVIVMEVKRNNQGQTASAPGWLVLRGLLKISLWVMMAAGLLYAALNLVRGLVLAAPS